MKRIFVALWLCFITHESIGGVLSCQANYISPGQPWSVIGLDGAYTGFYEASTLYPGLTGMFMPNLARNDLRHDDSMEYTIVMSHAASRALAGVAIRGLEFKLHGAGSWTDNYSQIIQADKTTYSGVLANGTNYGGLAIVLANIGTHSSLGSVEAASDFLIVATARYFRDNQLYGTSTHTTTANGTAMVTDTIAFPDKIDLGELEAGALTSAPAITASENKNNLSPTFKLISTAGEASVRVNDSTLTPGLPFTPPQDSYRIGIWLPENAAPGTHSANVGVNWTCP